MTQPSAFPELSGEVLQLPATLGPVELTNRLVIAPHTVNFGFSDGSPDDDYSAYLLRRARGFGLTWIPLASLAPLGRAEPKQPWLWDDRFIAGLASLAASLRACGTEPGLQLSHAGRQTSPSLIDGETPAAPSPIAPRSIYTTVPRELSVGEIEGLVEAYSHSARRAVQAGFRAINLHFGHGYLVQQFLSLDSNRRQDDYGGSLVNRMRFGLAIVEAIRAEVGPLVAIDVRLNGSDFVPGGVELEEATAFAHGLLARGADGLNVSGGVYGSSPFNLLLPFEGQEFLPLARTIRAETGAITTAVARFRTSGEAAEAIRSGACDLVGIGRSVIADPDWALKALGRLRRAVRPCLGTLDGCSERLRHFEPATCQVMPEVGRELQRIPKTAPRRLAIVGGGPGGCEAALYAAEQHGDEVLLVEEQSELGGTLRLAARAPGGSAFAELAEFHESELARLGVQVVLGTRADRSILAGFDPDHVLIATGARPDVPSIEGYEIGRVATDEEVLAGEVEVPARVAVLGAGRRAISTALACADRGAEVSLVDHRGERVAYDASALMRRAYKQQLARREVAVHAGPVLRLGPRSVVLSDLEVRADLVVLSVGMRPQREAANDVPPGITSAVIGDAKAPRSIMEAIAEARDAVDQMHA